MARKVVIIGGGIAGLGVAKTLKEKAPNDFEITVITKDTFYMAGPSRPLLVTGEQKYERIIRGYEEVVRAGIKVEYGLVTEILPEERKVRVAEAPTRPAVKEISYDYLVVAPGVVLDGTGIEGYEKYKGNVVNVYEPGRVDTFRHRLWNAKEGTVIVYAPKMPYRCAPAPSETTMLVHTVLKYRGVREKFRIIHVDANDKPQPPVIADIVTRLFEQVGVELITSRRIIEIGPDYVVLDSGERLPYTILAMLEPNRAPRFVEEAGLGKNWFEVRSPTDLRSVKYDDILAAGDVAKLPFPKNQEIAYESALYAANKIMEDAGVGEQVPVQYAFLGWAYVGNPEGRLETLSVKFGLNFTTKPPKPTKDPEPKEEYTKAKDSWEQAYLKNLFLY